MKLKHWLLFLGILLFLILVEIISLAAFKLVAVDLISHPSIQFIEPLNGQTLARRDTLVHLIARDKEGIEHVELWVDGKLYTSKKSEMIDGSNPFPLAEMWSPEVTGKHVLTARAYNSKGHTAAVSVIIEVDEEGEIREIEPVGSAIQGDAGEGLEPPLPDGSTSPFPEDGEIEEPPLLLDVRIISEPLEGFISDPERTLMDIIHGIIRPDLVEIAGSFPLQVEALYLETDRSYDGVFCYLSLGGSHVERIPEDDGEYLTSGPGNYWDIQTLLGRENSRTVILTEDALTLNIMLNCWGAIFDAGAVYDLGTLSTAHPSSDWDGRSIDQFIIGASGWFRAGYRINPLWDLPDNLPVPLLTHRCWETPYSAYCSLTWQYPDDARERIDGFIINRNGTLVIEGTDPSQQVLILAEFLGTLPTCGRTDKYEVIAYKGDLLEGEKSPPSNPISITSTPCYAVNVRFDYVYLFCLEGDGSRKYCNEDNCWEHEVDWANTAPEGQFDICINNAMHGNENDFADYYDFMGCSYGTMWVNEEKVQIGEWNGTFGYCINMAGGMRYSVIDYAHGGTDSVLVPIETGESLLVGMNWYDSDNSNADDRQCQGEVEYIPADLERIAALPGAKETFRRTFCDRGGGMCGLEYTIQVIQLTPPSISSD